MKFLKFKNFDGIFYPMEFLSFFIFKLLRSLGSLQSECELAQDLDDELEMYQLQLFTLKYRLAAISDINFPTPSVFLRRSPVAQFYFFAFSLLDKLKNYII